MFTAMSASIEELAMAHTDRTVRWGHLTEIDYRTRPGSEAWRARHPRRIQKLSAWRRLHDLRTHQTVRRHARNQGISPSSDMTVTQMLNTMRRFEEHDAGIR